MGLSEFPYDCNLKKGGKSKEDQNKTDCHSILLLEVKDCIAGNRVLDHPLPFFVDHYIILTANEGGGSRCFGTAWSACLFFPVRTWQFIRTDIRRQHIQQLVGERSDVNLASVWK